MSVDKAVSTEDLCAEEATSTVAGALRLEAFLNTLVECKVESLKNEQNGKTPGIHSGTRNIFKRLKRISSPKPTLRIEREKKKDAKTKRRERIRARRALSEQRQFKRQVLRQETSVSVSSHDSQICHQQFKRNQQQHECSSISDEEIQQRHCVGETPCMNPNWPSCQSLPEMICYCHNDRALSQCNESDYISLKIDGYADESDIVFEQEELKRQRRKRRRRRKRKMKNRLGTYPHLAVETHFDQESFKTLHDDDLPPRAKYTIAATACLLLFMCLLLVGITLRMAPLIDEIVREENEKLINQISKADNISFLSVQDEIR